MAKPIKVMKTIHCNCGQSYQIRLTISEPFGIETVNKKATKKTAKGASK